MGTKWLGASEKPAEGREGGWYVVCSAGSVGPFRSQEAARRRLEETETLGECHEEHRLLYNVTRSAVR